MHMYCSLAVRITIAVLNTCILGNPPASSRFSSSGKDTSAVTAPPASVPHSNLSSAPISSTIPLSSLVINTPPSSKDEDEKLDSPRLVATRWLTTPHVKKVLAPPMVAAGHLSHTLHSISPIAEVRHEVVCLGGEWSPCSRAENYMYIVHVVLYCVHTI